MFFDEEIDRVFKRMSGSFFNTGDIFGGLRENAAGPSPLYYGYTMTVGPDGRPVVREFGNARPELGANAAREPTVDVIADQKENQIKLVAEMPGVEKADIKVAIQDKTVDITAARGEKKYHAKVPLRQKIDEDSAKASYKNGILELVCKLAEVKPQGKTVEVD